MAVSALGGAVSSSSSPSLQNLGVSQLDLFRILVTQLSFQDPLKPIDNQEFIGQLAQFSNLEQTRQISQGIDTLLSIQAASQSVGLIGRTVEINNASGNSVGKVTTITFANGQPALTVQLDDGSFLTGIAPSAISVVR
jgi:flagellar basal-body rod modification protein FlgD